MKKFNGLKKGLVYENVEERKELFRTYEEIRKVFVEEARGKKLHIGDERILQEAEKMICDEFSYVLGISKEEVPDYIKKVMREKAEV